MTKAELRSKYLQLRKALSEPEYRKTNEQLCINFFTTVDLSHVFMVHIFLPMTARKEPDTGLIIQRLTRDFPTIALSIPRLRQASNDFESVRFKPGDRTIDNAWGIPEPVRGIVIQPEQVDLVIVPLLAFDESGNRVGYGKGFYDKFLASCRKDTRKIGLSAFAAEKTIEDLSPQDIPLDLCVTPTKTWDFSEK